jgi:hypothetical protein
MPDMVFDNRVDYSANLVGLTIPERIKRLPVCPVRRIPVPWFVSMTEDGVYEFRAVEPEKLFQATIQNLCWVCGEPRGKNSSFVLGPMCTVNRNSAEPPSHHDCAVFSAQACPFLTKPHMRRRENDLPVQMSEQDSPGIFIKRNPGCVAIWTTRKFTYFRDGKGLLFTPGDPESVEWFAEGRQATRLEVTESIDSGLPILMEMAEKEPDKEGAIKLLHKLRADVEKYLPKE